MNSPVLLSPLQAEPQLADVFGSKRKCCLEVREERAFITEKGWLRLGHIAIAAKEHDDSALTTLIRQGAFEWNLPSLCKAIDEAAELLDIDVDENRQRIANAMAEVASAATRAGLVHPRFDPAAIEQMPFADPPPS